MVTAPKTLLVTGFGAFPGVARNPSADLIDRLTARPPAFAPPIEAALHLLPVTWAMLDNELPALYEAHRPDAVVHFGVASRRRMVCIEARARNVASLTSPDADGRHFEREILDDKGPASRPSTLPLRDLLSAVDATGNAARLSRDAGDYLCNAALWTSLAHGLPSVFVHVPHPSDDETDARPSLDGLEAVARAVIATVAGHMTA